MSLDTFAFPTAVDSLQRGIVAAVHADGTIVVDVDPEGSQPLACEQLITGTGHLSLIVGDVVLCYSPSGNSTGVVLGRIGAPRATAPVAQATSDRGETPNVLVLEAKHGLVLRVGDGSIEIRADGKILIKGTDLVSHAKRMNRIKGGAVSIN
jgi:hypothetical protein